MVPIPTIKDARGTLSFAETESSLPFPVLRAYYFYDVPAGIDRGGHAHVRQRQLMIAMAGSFDVLMDDGRNRQTVRLSKPDVGIEIGTMIWREVQNLSPGAVCLNLASTKFAESDYLRDYEAFKREANQP